MLPNHRVALRITIFQRKKSEIFQAGHTRTRKGQAEPVAYSTIRRGGFGGTQNKRKGRRRY